MNEPFERFIERRRKEIELREWRRKNMPKEFEKLYPLPSEKPPWYKELTSKRKLKEA
jgi:hypothetical protein